MARRTTTPFTPIPRSVDEAIDSGALTPRRGNLLKRLIYRCGKKGETAFSLEECRSFVGGWVESTEVLRRDLKFLASQSWIALESPGPGAPVGFSKVWRLRLVGARVEFNSYGSDNDKPAIPPDKRESGSAAIPTASNEPSDNTDTDNPKVPVSADGAADPYAAEVAAIAARSTAAARAREDPTTALLASLRDADYKTRDVFERRLPGLTEAEVEAAKRRLEWRHEQTEAGLRDPLRSETAFVVDFLKRCREKAA